MTDNVTQWIIWKEFETNIEEKWQNIKRMTKKKIVKRVLTKHKFPMLKFNGPLHEKCFDT